MLERVSMSVSVLLDLVLLAAAATAAQDPECRAIADPVARLTCYDLRDRKSLPPSAGEAPMAVPPSAAPRPAPAPSSGDAAGRIASVAPLKYGLFRLTLDDGRMFDTATNKDAPPAVGASVTLRRSFIGTTFLDVPGRSPLTVRRVRQ